MKKLIILSFLVLLSFSPFAQNKFGYIDKQEMFFLMPETKQAEVDLQSFTNSLLSQLSALEAELQAVFQNYQENEASYDVLTRKDKETEITNLQKRVQDFQKNAQKAVQNKEIELLEPIGLKINQAIEDVAKEGDYVFIFDKNVLHYFNEANNVFPLVKKKLGL